MWYFGEIANTFPPQYIVFVLSLYTYNSVRVICHIGVAFSANLITFPAGINPHLIDSLHSRMSHVKKDHRQLAVILLWSLKLKDGK